MFGPASYSTLIHMHFSHYMQFKSLKIVFMFYNSHFHFSINSYSKYIQLIQWQQLLYYTKFKQMNRSPGYKWLKQVFYNKVGIKQKERSYWNERKLGTWFSSSRTDWIVGRRAVLTKWRTGSDENSFQGGGG